MNDAPVATDDVLAAVAEDSGTRIISFASLLGNDSKGPADETGQTLTITAVSNVVGGTAVINGTNIEFTPAANFNGPASFDYTVQDNGQTNGVNDFKTDTGSVSFAVTSGNDAPTITSGTTGTEAENTATNNVVYTATATEPDAGDAVTWSLTGADAALFNIDATGHVRFNASPNFEAPTDADGNNVYDINVVATDNGALVDTKAVAITVTNANEAPVVSAPATGSASAGSGTSAVNLLQNASDVDHDAVLHIDNLIWTDAESGLPEGFNLNGNSILVDTNDLAYAELASGTSYISHFSYNVVDESGALVHQTAMITITGPSNDTLIGTTGEDTLRGFGGYDTLQGLAGNDLLDGGNLVDRAIYTDATGPITVDMAAGTVSGAGVGTDTIISVEQIRGSSFADTYVATGFAGASIVGSSLPTSNQFEGMAEDDIITGNGTTQLSYQSATATVIVDFIDGTASGDASVGHDTFTGVSGVRGSSFGDILLGSNNGPFTTELFTGGGGSDFIDGRGGFDRAIYTPRTENDVTGEISVDLRGGTVVGDVSVGTDILRSIKSVRGTIFVDIYDATGFTASSPNAGSAGVNSTGAAFNEFEGMGGNDSIIGNRNTRISYNNATAGVTVDLAAGTASGDASVGNDTFTGVISIVGSNFADNLFGSNNGGASTETFEGRNGNDTFDGRGGFDLANYASDSSATTGITVNMAAGTVTGDSTVGIDTLISIEAVRGTDFSDIYVATGFTGASLDIGAGVTFNDFEGMGGDDIITGNGNTRIQFGNATAGVTVNLAAGTATGDGSVGNDTFTGVSRVRSSNFADQLSGSNNAVNTTEIFEGRAGNDTFDGRGGFDQASYNNDPTTVGISVNMAAGTVTGDAAIGVDALISIKSIRGTAFADTYIATGFAGASTDTGLTATFNEFEGLGGNDTITGNGDTRITFVSATAGMTVDLSAGTATGDSSVGTDSFTGVSRVRGSNLNDTIFGDANNNILEGQSGDDVLEGGAGNDTVNGGSGIDTASYEHAAGPVTVSLALPGAQQTGGAGTDTLSNMENLRGSAFSDTLIGDANNNVLEGGTGNDIINGGAGNDTANYEHASGSVAVSLASQGVSQPTGGAGNDTLSNMENLRGSGNDDILIGDGNNNVLEGGDGNDTLTGGGGVDVLTGGTGADSLTGGLGADKFRFISALDSQPNLSLRDTITDFNHGDGDKIDFSGITGIATQFFQPSALSTATSSSCCEHSGMVPRHRSQRDNRLCKHVNWQRKCREY